MIKASPTPDPVPGAIVAMPTIEELCRSILARHHDTISVRKPAVAVPRLARILEAALDL